jgi:inner membrane protein involved in colicin E2 resistance
MTVRTDFEDVDFPPDGTSPTKKVREGDGWVLTWDYDSLVSGRPIGLVMPKPSNPGPLAARISFFAPVSLAFYFAALVLTASTRPALRIHPMNFAFLAAGFFAFHLLFAYLVDRIDIYIAFAIASVVSVALCVAYLRLVVGRDPVVAEAAVGQVLFLVLFTYSFFFEGFTGLAVTIGSVVTLAYFMAKTGRVDWGEAFARKRTATEAPSLP